MILVLWRAYRKSPTIFRTVPSPTVCLYGLLFPKIGGLQPHPKTAITNSLLSQERMQLQTSDFAGTFTGPSEEKTIKNFGEKGAWAYPGTANFFQCPYYYLRNG